MSIIIIIIKLHRGRFYTFLLEQKQYNGNILFFFVEISYGDLLWGSYSDMTWDILGFGYFKMTWDIVSDMMGIRLEI